MWIAGCEFDMPTLRQLEVYHLYHMIQVYVLFVSMAHKFSMWWPEDKNSPSVAHAYLKKWLKWVPSAWEYSWVTASGGNKYGGLVLQFGGWAWVCQPYPIKVL
jgi:hypothetical protein